MKDKLKNINQSIVDGWRALDFYYYTDDSSSINQWQFWGSKKGLQNFINLLDEYTNNPENEGVSEHAHYGPYSYLKIMTWDKPIIATNYIAGTIQDLKYLKELIAYKLIEASPGQTFNIDKEYGQDNTSTAKFFVMADDFDPASMDEQLFNGD